MNRVSLDPRIGTEIAGYRMEALLGRGGMGVVYRALDLRLKRPVALKLVAPELAEDPRFRERFLRESELAASFDHSHVVPVYGAGETDDQLWIAMRYVEGTDLKSLLEREGPLAPARAVDLVGQIAEALDAAHAHGLVHRDVKPANALVADEGGGEHSYLSDFGLARGAGAEAEAAAPSHLSGTVDYTSPEQIMHEPADARADVYSLACVLYECLAGEPPFARQRPTATLFAHVHDEPPSLSVRRPDLPKEIDAVVARALAKEPEKRYPSCRELCEAARKALALDAHRFSRRALLLAGGGAALGLAAAAAVPTVLLTRGTPKAILPLKEDSVVRIDPATNAVAKAVPRDSAAGPLAFGEGSVWLADARRNVVSRIDPRASTVVEEIDMAQAVPPRILAVGEGAVWTAEPAGPTWVWRYDLATGKHSGVDTGNPVEGLATGDGALWAVCDKILRLDPETGQIELTLDTVTGGDLAAFSEGAVWFSGTQEEAPSGGRVYRVDSATSAVVATIDVDGVLADIAAGEGALWALGLEDDLVTRIDLATNRAADAFRVGRIPEAIAVGAGSVWVASARDGTVTRFDPRTADVSTIDIGGSPRDVVTGGGAVWVAVDT